MPQRVWFHLTAKMPPHTPDLTREDTGGWLWKYMREAFPRALGCSLMPDHPHAIVGDETSPELANQRLARLLGHFARVFGVAGTARMARVTIIENTRTLRRELRYVALNPCRDDLVRCPLAWPWSTHRDLVGACVDPWVTADRLARVLEAPLPGFAARHHAYVSGDPHAAVEGTPFPIAAPPTNLPSIPLRTIAEAVASATRTRVGAIRERGLPRALFVGLALEQGWSSIAKLADVCGCCPRTIRNLTASLDTRLLGAPRLVLGDARLLRLPPREPAQRLSGHG